MSVQIIKSKYGLVLTFLLGQIMLFAAPVQAGVQGKSYNMNVYSSRGDNFTACFQFDPNGTLEFLGQNATYNVSTDQISWQAVTQPPSPLVSIALKGVVQGDFVAARAISGTALNSNGTTFTFNGTVLSQPICPAQLPLSPTNLQFGRPPGNPFLE
ncbi:MAG: hypothetical protein V7K14_12250 [Nostoc sp.]|uniref:hypothetical protein n=1 Tax=unclassified Nostoc TaxID=2593658 RepID=UPI0025DD014B|nr:hypothetical protein [Nostoc sp. NMS7]MBN3948327.1 hypothetical protein [Nostoc sp. NMS7]